MYKIADEWLAALFEAGAAEACLERGMSRNGAEAFSRGFAEKRAAKRYVVDDEEEEDEDGTWWSRNKKWALPTAIGLGAFLVGGDAGRWGDPDRGYFTNALLRAGDMAKALFGVNTDPQWISYARRSGVRSLDEIAEAKRMAGEAARKAMSPVNDVPKSSTGNMA